jgi:hypothetical protein
MMRRKQLPERLCEQVVDAFGHSTMLAEQRVRTASEAQRTFGLNEAQWVCLLFAPFVEQGAMLERFLRQCHPGMLVAMPELHRAMQGQLVADQIMQWMVDVSGLSVSQIGMIYQMGPVSACQGQVIDAVSGDTGVLIEADDATSLSFEKSAGR